MSKLQLRVAAGLAFVILLAVGVIAANVKAFTLKSSPAHVAVKADLGDPAVEKMAVDQVAQAAQQQGLVVEGTKIVSDKSTGPYERVVRVLLKTNAGTFRVDVTLSKSLWSVKSLNVV